MFASRVKTGEQHIKTMIDMIQELRKTISSVKEQFTERDKAWRNNNHYNSKIQGLQDQLVKIGSSSPKMVDKMNRNLQKQQEANQSFQSALGQTAKLAHEVLETKWDKVGQALSKFCKFYLAIFDGSEKMSIDMALLAEEFSREAMSDNDWVKKAQAVGQKARDRVTGFASSAKDAFDSVREKGSFPMDLPCGGGGSGGAGGSGAGARGEGSCATPDAARGSLSAAWSSGGGSDGTFSPGAGHRADSFSSGATPSYQSASGGMASPWGSFSSSASGSRPMPAASSQSGFVPNQDPFSFHQGAGFGSGSHSQQQNPWPVTSGFASGMPSPWGPQQNVAPSQNAANSTAGSPWGSPAQQTQKHDPWS